MDKTKTKVIDFYYIDSPSKLEELLPYIYKAKEGALDTETYEDKETYGEAASWTDFNTSIVRLISLYINNLDAVAVIDIQKIGDNTELIERLSKIPLLVAHNAIYDIGVMLANFKVRFNNIYCSMTAVKSINLGYGLKSGTLRGNSLLSVGRDFFDYVRDDKSLQKSDWSSPELSVEQLAYSALDVGAPKNRRNSYTDKPLKSIPLELYKLMEQLAIDTEQRVAFMCDQKILSILAEMKGIGLPMNKSVLTNLNKVNAKLKRKTQENLCKYFKWRVSPILVQDEITGKLVKEYPLSDSLAKLLNNNKGLVKYVNAVLKEEGINILVPDLTKETLTDVKSELKDLNQIKSEMEELNQNNKGLTPQQFERAYELINNLTNYKKAAKLLTEGIKYISLIKPSGNIHCDLKNPGTVTGRFSGGAEIDKDSVVKGVKDTKMNLQAMPQDTITTLITLRELLTTTSTLPGYQLPKLDLDKIISGDLDADTPYELALSLRGACIAPNGLLFADSDASGQELVDAGYISGEEGFIDVFRTKIKEPYIYLPDGSKVANPAGDLHTQTAMRMYPEIFEGVIPEKILEIANTLAPIGKSYRQVAKIIGFSLIYGKNAQGFAEDFGCTEKEAEAILDSYFKAFPKLKRWLDTTANRGKVTKYITTPVGGNLYVAEENSKGKSDLNTLARKAPNAVIQGLAAIQIKLALIDADKKFEDLNMKRRLIYPNAIPGKIILAIHDQITGLVPGEYKITGIHKGHLNCEYDDTAIQYKTILKEAIAKAMQTTLSQYAKLYTPGEMVYATAGDILSPLWVHG
jgi:DNA polymerase I-like protein with 3'-5' exonuclease and polymerase domains